MEVNVQDSKCCVMKEGTHPMDPHKLHIGRPHGGTLIMCKSTLAYRVITVETNSSRLSCVKVYFNGNSYLLLFCVYRPYVGENMFNYQDILYNMSLIC